MCVITTADKQSGRGLQKHSSAVKKQANKLNIPIIESNNLKDHVFINNDGDINILDVVSLINFVLNNNYSSVADLNNDNVLNVLDIVQLVTLVLGN